MVILFDGLTCNPWKLQFQKYFFFNSTVRASQSLNCWSSEELVIDTSCKPIEKKGYVDEAGLDVFFCDTGELVGFTKNVIDPTKLYQRLENATRVKKDG